MPSGADLLLRRKRFEDVRLVPFFADAFLGDWIGVVRFERNADGCITGFAVSNPSRGVRHLVFERDR